MSAQVPHRPASTLTPSRVGLPARARATGSPEVPTMGPASQDEGLTLSIELTPEQLDLNAGRVADLLRPTLSSVPAARVDAQTVAEALGVSRECVYDHKHELGGQPIGQTGEDKRPRWRFDLDQAREAWNRRSSSEESQGAELPASTPVSRRPRRQRKGSGRTLLPIHGNEGHQRRAS
jgi:hypothetical protein